MVGLIIIGHGNFASGMASSLQLIAGEKEGICFINFTENDTIHTLEEKIQNVFKQLEEKEQILVLCDLIGGSPFKSAVELAQQSEKPIEVIGGMNLPMLIELSIAKEFVQTASQLADRALEIGASSIVKYVYKERKQDNSEEGI